MTQRDDRTRRGRRDFLKLAGLGTVAGGVTLVTGRDAAQASEAAADERTGYRETDHIKKIYDLSRF